MRLIDADSFKKALETFDEKYELQKSDVYDLLTNAPTVQHTEQAEQAIKLALLEAHLKENNIQPPTDNLFVAEGCEKF